MPTWKVDTSTRSKRSGLEPKREKVCCLEIEGKNEPINPQPLLHSGSRKPAQKRQGMIVLSSEVSRDGHAVTIYTWTMTAL